MVIVMDWRVFKEIPENYSIESIITKGNCDLNSIEVFRFLYEEGKLTNGTMKEVDGKIVVENERRLNGDEYSAELFSFLAKEYIDSALVLAKCVLEERAEPEKKLSSYANPCSFLCRHAIELKIKQCLCCQHQPESITNKHNLSDLWEALDKTKLDADVITSLTDFIYEVSELDKNGITWRYGSNNKLLPINERINVDCFILTQNTMFLFNQLHKIAY